MLEIKKKGKRTKNNESFEKIAKLKKGEFVVITNKDWGMSTLPGKHLIRRRLNREFKVETLKDDSGWVITALD
jgi:hypothetical protein